MPQPPGAPPGDFPAVEVAHARCLSPPGTWHVNPHDEDPLRRWHRLFPGTGGGWPELEVAQAEVGLGVRLPDSLRGFLVEARPPDGAPGFRNVALHPPRSLDWSEAQPRCLAFASMRWMGVSFLACIDDARPQADPAVIAEAGLLWRRLPSRLSRWLLEYSLLMRLDTAPTTGLIRCDGRAVERVESTWQACLIDWTPTLPTLPRKPRTWPLGSRSPLAARVFLSGDGVAEVVSETEIVLSAPSDEALDVAARSLGILT